MAGLCSGAFGGIRWPVSPGCDGRSVVPERVCRQSRRRAAVELLTRTLIDFRFECAILGREGGMRFRPFAIIIVLLAAPVFSDEGMWTFDNFPSETVKAKYGVTIDKTWLDRVRMSAVRLSTGCSASVVTGEGLV